MIDTLVYKPTHDDWHPSFKLEDGFALVRVSFYRIDGGEEGRVSDTFLVCAWGDDDMGLEREFESERDAWQCFIEIIGWEFVDREPLKQHFNFVPA